MWAPKTWLFFIQVAKANCDFSSSNLRELNRSDMNFSKSSMDSACASALSLDVERGEITPVKPIDFRPFYLDPKKLHQKKGPSWRETIGIFTKNGLNLEKKYPRRIVFKLYSLTKSQ